MRRQIVVPSAGGLVPRIVDGARALGRGVRRGIIRAAAIVAMLAIYVGTSLGSLGTSALGVVGVSGAALVGSATPADAWGGWRRRRHHRWRRHRGYYGWGWGHRGYYGWGWRHRRRRRWRRRRPFGIYFHF
jgi:hypothetical protein